MEEIIIEEEMCEWDVTCHTEGCECEDMVIRITAQVVDLIVVCGACAQSITDCVMVADEV